MSPRGLLAALKARPILCLALLTPGIPEYLSTSSSLLAAVVNPAWFLLAIGINVGQYTAGALLIREAAVRWRRGWATVAVLGLAYGVIEEGLCDNTLFNSTHGTDGILGHFGRFVGVNWIWSCGVLAFHVLFSIGIPLLLLRSALPSIRGRPLLSRRGVVLAVLSLAAATAVETAIVWGADRFWMGTPLLVGALATIAALVTVAYLLPAGRPSPLPGPSTLSPRVAGAAGFALFPCLFAVEYGLAGVHGAAPVALGLDVLVLAAFVGGARRFLDRERAERLQISAAAGAVLFLAAFGLLVSLPIPYTVPLIVVLVVFLQRVLRGAPGREPPAAAGAGDRAFPSP